MGAADGWSVATLDAAMAGAYAELVAAAPASPVTHTLAYRDALAGLGLGQPVYWLGFRGGRLRAALPAFVRRSEQRVVLNSLPFVQSAGGVITPADASPAERAEAVTLLMTAMLSWCRAEGVQVACVVGSPYRGQQDAVAFPRAPDFCMLRSTHVLDLTEPLAPRPSIDWTVRKADRLQPRHRVASSAAEARAVYEVYAANMRRLGVSAHPWALFEALPEHARFVWAEVAGEMVSVLILLVHRQVLEYHAVGNTEAGRRLQTNSWLCWRELAWARDHGIRWWNWGASPSKAVHDFKKRWGGHDLSFPIWGFCLGDVSSWRRLTPAQLTAAFPAYFVLPYDQLESPS